MARDEELRFTGTVEKAAGNSKFIVKLDSGHSVTAHISGKMRMNNIKIILADTVEVVMSPYDLTKGRIVYRQK